MNEFIVFGNTIYQYFIFFLILNLVVWLGKGVYWLFKHFIEKRACTREDAFKCVFVRIIGEPIVFLMVIIGFYFGKEFLTLAQGVDLLINNILKILTILGVTYIVIGFIDAILIYYVKPFVIGTKSKMDDQLFPGTRVIIRFIIIALAIIICLDVFGIKVTTLLAGLGIVGIALAMAAKDILANLFGFTTVFTDRPFQIGDIVKIKDYIGTVKDVGLRSTRIKTLANTEVIIPNSDITSSIVENISQERGMKQKAQILLSNQTSFQNIQKALDILKNILRDAQNIDKRFYVSFNKIDPFGFIIQIVYWIKFDGDYEKYVATKSKVNLEIKKQLEEAEITIGR